MRTSVKLIALPVLLVSTLLLAGCSPAVKTISQGSDGTISTSAPSSSANTNEQEVEVVTQRFEDFMDAAYAIDPDDLTNILASTQSDIDWDDPVNQEGLINQFEQLLPEVSWIDTEGLSWSEKGVSYASICTYNYYGGSEGKVDFTIPEGAVKVDGDTATIDASMVTTDDEGVSKSLAELQELETTTLRLTKVDGEWLFNASDLVAGV